MKTKTEELLVGICSQCEYPRNFCNNCDTTKLLIHLAPLIAKERVIAKLREYESEGEEKLCAPFYCKENNLVYVCEQKPEFLSFELSLYSTESAWMRVINDMPETILEAFGWEKTNV